ncbi:hypothetical protein [Azospirillum sp.]|uniref:hypothetical protein n=1 Tax=Azospirillum sp. TaxID=34012 RepID=UPI003D713BD8
MPYIDVWVEPSDVLREISTKRLAEELKERKDYIAEAGQPPIDAEFLEDLARTLELSRPMDASERRRAALRLREMITEDNNRASQIAEAYRRWQTERNASH